MTSPSVGLSIAVVVSSTRPQRLCPYIAQFILDTLSSNTLSKKSNFRAEVVDISDHRLPLYDEPEIPSHLPMSDPTPFYAHEHTRAWSTVIKRYDGYIFVTPQYNWSIPAALKNALDYLFHEWAGKPAAIVSYGSKGGLKAADHLRTIMKGLRMRPMEISISLKTGETLLKDCTSIGILPDSALETWQEEDVTHQLCTLVAEFLALGSASS